MQNSVEKESYANWEIILHFESKPLRNYRTFFTWNGCHIVLITDVCNSCMEKCTYQIPLPGCWSQRHKEHQIPPCHIGPISWFCHPPIPNAIRHFLFQLWLFWPQVHHWTHWLQLKDIKKIYKYQNWNLVRSNISTTYSGTTKP